MKHIHDALQKRLSTISGHTLRRITIAVTVSEVLGKLVSPEQCQINSGVLIIKVSPQIKHRMFLKQKLLIGALKERLPHITITRIA